MSSCTLPEVTQLLERFQVKKATVKTRLNDIVDDLFGEFLSEVARMGGSGAKCCSKCSCHSADHEAAVSCDTPSSNVEEVTPQNLKVLLPKAANNLETTIRSAQARARELIKDEFYDSDPVSRLSQSSGSSLKPSSSTRSLPESADDEMDPPEVTLTPIQNVASSAAALAAMVSSSKEMSAILNGSNGDHHIRNLRHHRLPSTDSKSSNTTKAHPKNNGHRSSKDDFDSEEEFETTGQLLNEDDHQIKAANGRTQQTSHAEESQEEKSEAEEEVEEVETSIITKSPPEVAETNDPNENALFTEKSLEELNSLCAGLPYAKQGGKYLCKFQDCTQELKSRHNLLLHQRAHLGIRPYRCKWSGCSYNSNQSSAVIRHIRTKHFLLPLTMREQQMKKIEDDRDPKEFLEVVTLGDGAVSTSSAATPEQSLQEPSSESSLQSGATSDSLNCETSNHHITKLRSRNSNNNNNSSANGKGRRSVLLQQNNSNTTPTQQQSLLMPPQQSTNGRSLHKMVAPAAPPLPSRASHDESDEDEYDSEENDFEMLPMHHQDFQRSSAQQQQQQAMQNAFMMQQTLAAVQQQVQHSAAQLHSKSPFDYARKRRLESKIFANAALSNRNRLSGNNNDYYGNGSAGKRAKSMGGSYGQHSPTTLEPLAAHSSSFSSSSSHRLGGSGGLNQHQYSFCPEEGCHSIFRTTNELDRHLTDVHGRLPQQTKLGGNPGGPPKEPQTYQNLYICKWPKCPFSTVLHSSAINHVRGKHFNIPRTLTAQQRKFYANDTRNPNDFIKLLPFNNNAKL